MIEGSCHCGAVRYTVPFAPEVVKNCNCSICRRIGGLWAYYSPAQVKVEGPTAFYKWGDKMLELHHCETCGCTTHWTAVDKGYDRMGLNARMMDPKVLAAARVCHFDGADTWTVLREDPAPGR